MGGYTNELHLKEYATPAEHMVPIQNMLDTEAQDLDEEPQGLDDIDCFKNGSFQMMDEPKDPVSVDTDGEDGTSKTEVLSDSDELPTDESQRRDGKIECHSFSKNGIRELIEVPNGLSSKQGGRGRISNEVMDLRLSYVDSQEPGEFSQANALACVQRLIDESKGEFDNETNTRKIHSKSSSQSMSAKGPQRLAKKANHRNSDGKEKTYDWDDRREDEGGGDIFCRRKTDFYGGKFSRKKMSPPSTMPRTFDLSKPSQSHHRGGGKSRFLGLQSDSKMLLHRSKANENAALETKQDIRKNLLNEFEELCNVDTSPISLNDVGVDTQIAAEAMGALLHGDGGSDVHADEDGSCPHLLPSKPEPSSKTKASARKKMNKSADSTKKHSMAGIDTQIAAEAMESLLLGDGGSDVHADEDGSKPEPSSKTKVSARKKMNKSADSTKKHSMAGIDTQIAAEAMESLLLGDGGSDVHADEDGSKPEPSSKTKVSARKKMNKSADSTKKHSMAGIDTQIAAEAMESLLLGDGGSDVHADEDGSKPEPSSKTKVSARKKMNKSADSTKKHSMAGIDTQIAAEAMESLLLGDGGSDVHADEDGSKPEPSSKTKVSARKKMNKSADSSKKHSMVGIDTQIAAEAMEALLHGDGGSDVHADEDGSRPHLLPSKPEPSSKMKVSARKKMNKSADLSKKQRPDVPSRRSQKRKTVRLESENEHDSGSLVMTRTKKRANSRGLTSSNHASKMAAVAQNGCNCAEEMAGSTPIAHRTRRSLGNSNVKYQSSLAGSFSTEPKSNPLVWSCRKARRTRRKLCCEDQEKKMPKASEKVASEQPAEQDQECGSTVSQATPVDGSPICMDDGYLMQSCKSNSKTYMRKEVKSLFSTWPRAAMAEGKDSRKRRDLASVRILFSNHLEDDTLRQQKKILERLKIPMASSMADATHFVADEFVRTRNMLAAMASGILVVTHLWLENVGRVKYYIDEAKYILRDLRKEKEIGFNMAASLARARQHPLLQGRKVFLTPNTKPSKEIVSSLVKAVHGQAAERIGRSALKDDTVPDDLLLLSSEEDYEVCVPFLEKGASIYSAELLLNGIVTQKLEYGRHQLFADHVKKTRSTIWLKKDGNKFSPVTKIKP